MVQDTGTGMSAETRSQSGGHISVDSEPGRGTTFRVYLPRAEQALASAARNEDPISAADLRGHEVVLVAEDMVPLREMIREVLESSGYRVVTAPDGEEALIRARGLGMDVDLLLTDVVMPGMSGRQLADELTTAQPGLRVLYMSGFTDDAMVRHGVFEHQVAILEKPFGPDALVRKVREVLTA
jgi:two-component system, cell cycle sensor histidine kinase and response regulator CckA